MKKLGNKILASMMITIMMLSYVATIGIYGMEVYANENVLETQGVKTNSENVEFDAYFVKENRKTHSVENQIGEENSVYVEINVKNAGYLKNAKIEFTGSIENTKANFLVKEPSEEAQQISKVSTEENTVKLNQINKNEKVNVAIPIYFDMQDKISLSQFSKENKAKLTATYIDEKGKEKEVNSEITIKLDWNKTSKIALEEQIAKYVPYEINGQKAVILQTVIKSSLLDNSLPVKETNIEIKVPTIANTKPTSVKVAANSTKATNNDINAINFTQDNYTYNKDTSKLEIKVENKVDENNNVEWAKNAQDEYIVTYTYPQDILENMPEEGNKITLETKANITTYGIAETNIIKTLTQEAELKDSISNIVSYELYTNVEQLSKGYIYANYDATEKIETEYKEAIIANVGDATLVDNIALYSNVDNFVLDENTKGATTVNSVNYAYAKELKIEKEIYDKFIGEDGEISLYKGENLIATINKDSIVNNENNIVVDISEFDVNELTIITSKPKVEGNIKIEITKALKKDIAYSKSQMKAFTALEVVASGKMLNNNVIIEEKTETKNINLIDPKSVAEITINNTNLSTVTTNKDVEIRAVLKTNSLDYNLYKNPSITITLPSYIEKINVKNVQILFNDELKISSANLVENQDGTKQIVLQLEGTQTKYDIGNIAGGANIVITADIDVNKLTPNTTSEIKMNYTNENVIEQVNTYARVRAFAARFTVEQNETSTPVSFLAPTGIVTMNGIAGYKEGAEEITSISGEDKIATIDIMSEAKVATFNMSVMNNYNNTLENIVILGKTPFVGNKKIEKSEDLGSTMNLGLTSPINISGIDSTKVEIYYSENGEASKDLSLASNGWTKEVTDFSKVKSYLIVTNNYVMNTADSITFNYSAQIPENLQHNQSAYETYAVYFTNNLETGVVEDKQESAKVGVTTGKGPVLEASISSNIKETEEVLTDRFIKYTVTVKNAGEEVVDNVVATIDLPQYLSRVEFDSEVQGAYIVDENSHQIFEIGNVEAGKSIEKEFYVIVNNLEIEDICTDETHYINFGNIKYHSDENKHSYDDYKTISSLKAKITAKDLQKEIVSNEVKNTIKQAHFILSTDSSTGGEETLNENCKFKFYVNVGIYDQNEISQNTVVRMEVPKEIKYEKAIIKEYNSQIGKMEEITKGIDYNDETRMLTINLGTLTISNNKEIEISYITNYLEEGIYSKEITNIVTVESDNIKAETSIPLVDTISKEKIKISQTSNIVENTKLDVQDELIYIAKIDNLGGNNISVKIKDTLPKELIYESTEYTVRGETGETRNLDNDNTTELSIIIPKGESAEVKIYTVVGEVSKTTTISNIIKASSENISEIESNVIKHTINEVKYDEEEPNNELRKISGQVWKDENKNGIKDENEPKMSDVKVVLCDSVKGNMQIATQITSKDGTYTFRDVPKGKYTLVFLYDTANYSSTAYQKESVDEVKNSDAIDTQITLDGKKQTAAITEEIEVSNSNIYNIDLGLVENPKFDLKLDKTVSKIIVQNGKETKEYDYTDSKLAKRDLVGKEISSTTVIIQYKIKVTNEGAVSGYVKKIADYMPSELKFNSELNKDWYQGENGTIYNASLSNTIINPGETKEVTLLLTKKLSDENIGIIQNSAEIYEAYNDLGIEDIDSKTGNKQTDEDDYSSADILLTVKTGETIIFISLSLGIISIITVCAYIIKRKIVG